MIQEYKLVVYKIYPSVIKEQMFKSKCIEPLRFLIIIGGIPQTDFREWSLITGRGGLQNGRGGHVKFYPYEKGGRKKF